MNVMYAIMSKKNPPEFEAMLPLIALMPEYRRFFLFITIVN